MNKDTEYLRHAIRLAKEAQQDGNLPIGAVITLDGKVVAEGKNSIWIPEFNPGRHAEIEALDAVPPELWARAREMTVYTTLEPCVMCTSTILVHRIGRIVFGSSDSRAGGSCVFGHMPPAFERLSQTLEYVGPALPEECDELDERVRAMFEQRKSRTWGADAALL
jgi:tRNA(adenine34) deaminase